jgi:hypothetical protein
VTAARSSPGASGPRPPRLALLLLARRSCAGCGFAQAFTYRLLRARARDTNLATAALRSAHPESRICALGGLYS